MFDMLAKLRNVWTGRPPLVACWFCPIIFSEPALSWATIISALHFLELDLFFDLFFQIMVTRGTYLKEYIPNSLAVEKHFGQRRPRPSTMSEWGFPAGVVLGSDLRVLLRSHFRSSYFGIDRFGRAAEQHWHKSCGKCSFQTLCIFRSLPCPMLK